MQAPQKLINLKLTMGSPKNTNDLVKANLRVASGVQQTKQLKQDINWPHQLGEELVFAFTFGVDQGREKECIEYIEAGMAAHKQGKYDHLSPFQVLFQRPKQYSGTVQFQLFPGKVIVTYRFKHESIEKHQEVLQYFHQIHANFSVHADLKGHVAHNNSNRTAVKIDYSLVSIESDKMQPQEIVNVVQNIQPEFAANPAFRMIGKAKKMHLQLHTNSFRKIKGFFERCKSGEEQVQHETKDFPYVAQGILKSTVQFNCFYKNSIGLHADAEYHSEEVFLRLIKVYTVFFKKGFD